MSKTTHTYFKDRIREMCELGYSAPDIQKMLEQSTPEHLFDQIPSLRTIQRYVRQSGSFSKEEWNIMDFDPDDARLVLDVLPELFAWYEHYKRPRVSNALADAIVRVSKLAPDFPRTAKAKIALMLISGEHTNEIYDLLAYLPHRMENYRSYMHHCQNAYEDFEAHTIYKRLVYDDLDRGREVIVWDFSLSFTLANAPDWLKIKNPTYDLAEGMAHPDYPGNIWIQFDNEGNPQALFT